MKRVAAALSATLAALTCVTAAPVPTHLFPKTPPLYFPTTVRTTWVYEDADAETTLVISKVEQTDVGKMVTVERVTARGATQDAKMLVSRNGLLKVEGSEDKTEPPLVILKTPCTSGDTWKVEPSVFKGTVTVRGVEEVKVPAGTFYAVRVDSQFPFGGQNLTYSDWYAPEVGLVKSTSWEGKTRVLKSFTRGKE